MAATKVVIIYSVTQNLRRRVIKPHDDSQIDLHTVCGEGEAAVVVDLEYYDTLGADAVLGQCLMQIPQSDRHCIVHNVTNEVLTVVGADHTVQNDVDAVSPHLLIPHDEAQVGWTYDPSTETFSAPDSPPDSPADSGA